MRLLVDVNVTLDLVLARAPHERAATALWSALERRGRGTGVLAAHAVTTLWYLVGRARGPAIAREVAESLLSVCTVAPVDEPVLRRALSLPGTDFEDAVSAAAAEAVGCDAIVTRDRAGFRHAPVRVIDPATAVAWLQQID